MQEVQTPDVSLILDRGPARAAGAADLVRERDPAGGEDTVELHPTPIRVVGPGRKERSYLAQIAALEGGLADLDRRGAELEASLEVAQLLERGTGRLVDRLEASSAAARAAEEAARQQANRLLVALGALQAENEQIRGQLATAVRPQVAAPARGGWRRWLGAGARRPL